MWRVALLIRHTREQRGWSRSDLADACVEAGTYIDAETIRRIEMARQTALLPDLVVPLVQTLGIERELYLEALGIELW
jgi:ribosome-binding protein aMBF1 (putative translation factor)